MPVLESQPNELNTTSTATPYGCRDRVIKGGYYMDSRVYSENGTFATVQKFIPHTMSTECRYSSSLTDTRCATCKHKGSGEDYDLDIRLRGN